MERAALAGAGAKLLVGRILKDVVPVTRPLIVLERDAVQAIIAE